MIDRKSQSYREALIEKVGRDATEAILELQEQIDELHEYFGLVRVAHSVGWKLRRNPAIMEGQAASDPQNKQT